MIKIAPSILNADFWKLGEEIRKVEEAGADLLHIDVMDGRFVPNISMGIPLVRSLKGKTSLPLDVHLMIIEPEKFVSAFIDAGADILTFHVEATPHANRVIQMIKSKGIKAGIVLNPTTPLSSLEYILEDVDMVLLMSVNPGFGGQKFLPFVLKKIADLREMIEKRGLKVEIEVDGGIGPTNIKPIVKAGASIIVAGSSIFGAADPGERLKLMKKLAMKE